MKFLSQSGYKQYGPEATTTTASGEYDSDNGGGSGFNWNGLITALPGILNGGATIIDATNDGGIAQPTIYNTTNAAPAQQGIMGGNAVLFIIGGVVVVGIVIAILVLKK